MEHNQKIKLFGNRDFGGNFDLALNFIKQNFAPIFRSLAILIPVLLVAVFFMPNTQSMSYMDMSGYDNPLDIYASMFSAGFFLAYFLLMLVSMLVYLFVVAYMALYTKSPDGVVKSSEVWSKVATGLLPVFGGTIIFGILVSIGTLLCFIPGIIVYVYLGFYIYVYMNEDIGIINSFQRSYDLVKENWWVTFGYGLVFVLLISVASGIFAIPTYIAIFGKAFAIDFLASDIYMYIATLISSLSYLITYPILYMAMGVMYYSHRNNLEGVDMESEIDNIGVIDDSFHQPK